MLPIQEAFDIIIDYVKPLEEIETVNLSQAYNRILGKAVNSPHDFPYWDNSAMDGYGVRWEDLEKIRNGKDVYLEIIEEIPAGYIPQKKVKSNQCARIFTGAMMPDGADTVVMQEKSQRDGKFVKILECCPKGNFVRKKGSFYGANDGLLPVGVKINPPEMAILATAQCTEVNVVRSPLVAILSTGDELIYPHETLSKGKIIDSNQYLLHSFISQNGAISVPMGIIPDEKEKLEGAIASALEKADVVLSTGGVSVGEYDYVKEILVKLGGKILMEKVAIKPGKPLTVAIFPDNKLYFGIPGNPVSTMVICWRFLKSVISKLSGETNYYVPQIVEGVCQENLKAEEKRECYLWGRANIVDGKYNFSLSRGLHNSGNLVNLQQTNGLAILPVGVSHVNQGEKIKIMLV
ncbi:gephyrin-like molybdotransferase Glp [Cyanobacterium sp. IPPAS B-1200]|uniref:molybdopterin molybdotransferase MoeA n=1 Tax=Cyanobacterium sp. IPPAS B-1200 TaxID=1562720 RepID=UPI0008525524|nr:gephyrin-like molybdotransferase Glp [Cyanobacterium sp. IPPAS B-1200]OEJ77616.1 molybdopterin molybdenumtransferase [Cyanobacterium sp. IPPAS B-1200]